MSQGESNLVHRVDNYALIIIYLKKRITGADKMSKKIELIEKEENLVKEVMEELGLKGGKDKRLVSTIGKRTNFDKRRMIITIKRALIGRQEANSSPIPE